MFKTILLALFVSLTLHAVNPKPYAELGDQLYDSVEQFMAIPSYVPHLAISVENYLTQLKKVKAHGFEAQVDPSEAKAYLKALREIDTERRKIVVALNAALYNAIEENEPKRFIAIVRSGLIKLHPIKHDLLPYYEKTFKPGTLHVLDELLAEAKKRDAQEKARQERYAQSLEEARIERMRSASLSQAQEREATLDEEMERERERVNEMLESEMIR